MRIPQQHLTLIITAAFSLPVGSNGFVVPTRTTAASVVPSSSRVALSLPSLDNSQQELLTGLFLATSLGFVVNPIIETLFNATHIRHSDIDDIDFADTFAFGAANSITTSVRLWGVLLVTDFFLGTLGLDLPFHQDLGDVAPQVAFCLWAALTVSVVKRTIFFQSIKGRKLGRVGLYDRLIDVGIAILTLRVVLDIVDYDMGVGLQSVMAGSGIGALVFSLASKDVASAIVGGFIVQAWDAFEEGDTIKLGDGTEGKVTKIGLVETEIVGYDNISVKVPNSQLTSSRVSNLSRISQSRVYQSLRFQYADLDKLPDVLEDIKSEIRFSCPKLIADGSKPFQALIKSYETDHIEGFINFHFNIPVNSGAYAENRQVVLLAIARALKKNDVSFAFPSIVYQSKGDIYSGNGSE